MAKMLYSRYETTYNHLLDCYESMNSGEEELSVSEIFWRRMLLDLCYAIEKKNLGEKK